MAATVSSSMSGFMEGMH